ncbi:putative sodium/metabolite cotransporter BASS2 chloroplastic [Prunus yedoensis var. nudiflora]|uniref:Putative sodium/metabolite cotransporter BASS2 chloroplastic n=1 Tax=Prunus yedoensis var. nudiflora TaxID=2094558 RepID=A0A314ZF43_PRUYE|nr:putative sodium/metabolite cotransporter BASS2 chloroplastic [Prunus yedoensis var. nudiflora]
MTVCTTLGAVPLTPPLTKILAGTYVPVDAAKLSISTMQIVVAPILLGSYMLSAFPSVVKIVIPFAPLFAVLASCITACIVFSENVVRLKASMVAVTLPADLSLMAHAETVLSGEVGVCVVVEKAQGWYAKFFFGCGFGHFSFHLAGGCIARSIVCCDYEYNGKQSGILSEIYVHPSESKETPTIEVK